MLRNALIVLLVAAAAFAGISWRRSAVRADRLDRFLALNAESLKVAQVALVHAEAHTDTVKQSVLRLVHDVETDTLWRHDTVVVNGETRIAVPLPTIARWDTTALRCTELAASCERERAAWKVREAFLTTRVDSLEQARQAPPWYRPRCGIGPGAYYGTRGADLGIGVSCVWGPP